MIYITVPCWYKLSWRADIPGFLVKIDKDFIEEYKQIPKTAPIVRMLKSFNFPDFSGDLEKHFGFGGILKLIKRKNDFNEFLVEMPKIKIKTNEECAECKGFGKNEDLYSGECLYCNDTGKKIIYDWHTANMTSASLYILLMQLNLFKGNTSSKLPQLMTVRTITGKDGRGYSISGLFSMALRKWLGTLGAIDKNEYKLSQIIEAMKTSYGHMLGQKNINEYFFDAYVFDERGLFHASCPGNACSIGSYYNDYDVSKSEYGYKFDCHNIDSSAQQFTLLSGLAALHDQARQAMKNY